ncbi:hypothetical protein [Georgenia sunbinii]|uniref:hypothetical protein n=1 Tax=Georgenia sunbinii TaxID=3117728 RepID=UPI002F261A12
MIDQSYVRGQIVDDAPSAPTPKVSRPLALVAGGVLTLLLGMGIGDATSDPTESREYRTLEAELADAHAQVAELTEDVELLRQDYDR